ncbi:MAG: hypothetical protein U0325_12640 [Polyangiales bacterium]
MRPFSVPPIATLLSAALLACSSPRAPTRAATTATAPPEGVARTPSTPAPSPTAQAPAPPSPPPAFTIGTQADGALLARRSTPTAVVRGGLPVLGVAGLEGVQIAIVEHVEGARHEWRLHLARPGVDRWLDPEGMLLRAEPVELALHVVAPAATPLLFVRYADPRELPSVRAHELRAEAPFVFEARTGGATLDGVETLAEVPSRFPAARNLTREALATRTALSVGASLAEAPDDVLRSLLAPDLQWCTAVEGTPSVPERCRAMPPALRTAAFVRDTVRAALRRFADSEGFEQGADFAEGTTGNNHRVRLTFTGTGAARRVVRVHDVQIEHGE